MYQKYHEPIHDPTGPGPCHRLLSEYSTSLYSVALLHTETNIDIHDNNNKANCFYYKLMIL